MYQQITIFSEIMNHTGEQLLLQRYQQAQPYPKNLTNISKSSLQWLQVNLRFPSCWQFGLQPSAPFIQDCKMAHASTNLWANGYWPIPPPDFGTGWCLHNTHSIVYKTPLLPQPEWHSRPCIIESMKFSPTAPTSFLFHGPPITPMDPATGQVQLPVAQILPASNPTQNPIAYTMIQQQLQQSL